MFTRRHVITFSYILIGALIAPLYFHVITSCAISEIGLKYIFVFEGKMFRLARSHTATMGRLKRLGTVIKSPADKKEYRALKLKNDLTVLLISDLHGAEDTEEIEEEIEQVESAESGKFDF